MTKSAVSWGKKQVLIAFGKNHKLGEKPGLGWDNKRCEANRFKLVKSEE